jgi:hypothetical protein
MLNSIKANTIGKLHIPKQPIKVVGMLLQHILCHNVTQVYLPIANIKFFTINISCAISSKVLYDIELTWKILEVTIALEQSYILL